MIRRTEAEKREMARLRKARQREREKANQPDPISKPVKRPGKTPFASFIKVREIRRAGPKGSGLFYLDLIFGPLRLRGCHYDANTGSLHLSTAKDERRKPKLNGAYNEAVVRPIVIRAIEKWVGDERGKPYRFPKAAQFPPKPRRSRQPQLAAA